MPANELERQLGVTYKTAWRMGHEIRKHMALFDGEDPLSSNVEVDETYIGGKSSGGKRGDGAPGKTVVFGMIQLGGDVMTKIATDAQTRTLQLEIIENVEQGSTVYSDEFHAYKNLNKMGCTHYTVNHGASEYVTGETHVNSLEGYWSRLKTSIRGTHIQVSGKHLHKYTKEFEYHFNSRQNPQEMFPLLISTNPEQPKK